MTLVLVIVLAALAILVVVRLARRVGSPDHHDGLPEKWVVRGGVSQRADQAFDAWTSGDLQTMIAALDKSTNPVDRHFLLLGICRETYRERKNPEKRALFLKIATLHVQEFASLVGPLRADFGGELPRVPTFQFLATVLTEDGRFEEAVRVCELALEHDLHDGTQSGFEGRISRIKRRLANANPSNA